MYQEMATPNMYRSASGAPGPMYYQQKADYKMQVSLNEKTNVLTGSQTVTYTNNSPDKLEYLWIQLDQNQHSKNSPSNLLQSGSVDAVNTLPRFTDKYLKENFDGGFNITNVKSKGKNLKYTINQTMMRIDLDQPLQPGKSFTYSLDWWYNINNYQVDGFRSGFEQLEDGNKIYVIAQFFPRMAVYSDVEGWQNMQFWGSGEFALPFGDYEVDITVPADYMMEATGELQNRKDVFTKTELERYKKAENTFDNPVIVVTQKEAEAKRKTAATATKTWKF